MFDLKEDRGQRKCTDCVTNERKKFVVGWRTTQRHEKDNSATSSFTDEEERDKDWRKTLFDTLDHTWTRVCSQTLCRPQGGSHQVDYQPELERFFFRKREKAKVFSFSIKRNLYSSCSCNYSSIVTESLIPGVYIITLIQYWSHITRPLRGWLPSIMFDLKQDRG